MKKVAIFVDWENVRFEIESIQSNYESKDKILDFDCYNVKDIVSLLKSPVYRNVEEIYRIFFYNADPISLELEYIPKRFQNDVKKFLETEDFKIRDKKRQQIINNHKQLIFKDHFAVRKGMQRLIGFDNENKPLFQQKQVDMLLGLDIAHVAYQHLVDTIIVFSKDTDIAPALKCARMNGLHVSLANIKDGKEIISPTLRKHADSTRLISLIKEFGFKNEYYPKKQPKKHNKTTPQPDATIAHEDSESDSQQPQES